MEIIEMINLKQKIKDLFNNINEQSSILQEIESKQNLIIQEIDQIKKLHQ